MATLFQGMETFIAAN
jgi:hypothetical protein